MTDPEAPTAQGDGHHMYVGSFTAPHFAPGEMHASEAEGIYVFERHADGGLSHIQTMPAENPSSLAMAPDRKTLYAVSELGEDNEGRPLGRVVAYSRDPVSGRLAVLNSQSSGGSWPCHLSVSTNGGHLLVANYGSGSFAVLPLLADAGIGAISDLRQIDGSGPDHARQSGPHAHFIAEEGSLGRVLGADLGSDRVHVWTLETTTGVLRPAASPYVQSANGCGPRHAAFQAETGTTYVLNELSSSVDVFTTNEDQSGLLWVQTLSTLPLGTDFQRPKFDPDNPGFIPEGTNTASEIRLHPNGRLLFVTNRGMNTIATYSVSADTGQIEILGWTSTGGKTPRGMNIDPEGRYLYVGNQGSNNILVFAINGKTGALGDPLHEVPCPTPVDFVF